jgi:RNA polymerase sigma factor (sigma-70 family)
LTGAEIGFHPDSSIGSSVFISTDVPADLRLRSDRPVLSGIGMSGRWEARMSAVERTMTGQDLGDNELMRRLADGRTDALVALHARYVALVFGVAARALGRSAAEEVAQDVFVAVWRKAATFDPNRGSFRNWLLRIAHNRIVNEIRGRSRRLSPTSDPDGEGISSALDSGPGPDEALWRAHRRDVLLAALDALPPRQRQALRLAYLEELTHEQVAATLGLPLGTAKSRIHAGLQSLRSRLASVTAVGLVVAAMIGFTVDRSLALRRHERALRIVSSSDVMPLRLAPAQGVAPATHGSFRGRAGADIAVMTFTAFPPPPPGRVYRIWLRQGGKWTNLGTVHPDDRGSDLQIVESRALVGTPDLLEVTVEPPDHPAEPSGPVVVSWPAP